MNPGSKGGKSAFLFDRIKKYFNHNNTAFDFAVTKNLEDALFLSRSANKRGYDPIIAVGGDGTINRVLDGFFNAQGKLISKASLGVIYTGTSPDFCKSYHIPFKNINKALKTIVDHRIRSIPIGSIRYASSYQHQYNGQPVDGSKLFSNHYFGCCANIGLGALLAEHSNSGIRKYIGDFAGTFVSLLKTLRIYKPSTFHGKQDEKKMEWGSLYNLSVGLTRYIASGIQVKHALDSKKGQFYNLCVRNLRLIDIPGCLYAIYSGRPIKNSRIINLTYSKTIEVMGNPKCPALEFDGDAQGFLPCKIWMSKEKLKLIVGEDDGS